MAARHTHLYMNYFPHFDFFLCVIFSQTLTHCCSFHFLFPSFFLLPSCTLSIVRSLLLNSLRDCFALSIDICKKKFEHILMHTHTAHTHSFIYTHMLYTRSTHIRAPIHSHSTRQNLLSQFITQCHMCTLILVVGGVSLLYSQSTKFIIKKNEELYTTHTHARIKSHTNPFLSFLCVCIKCNNVYDNSRINQSKKNFCSILFFCECIHISIVLVFMIFLRAEKNT